MEYEIKKYQRGADMLAPKELKEVHPLGKAPVITDNGKVIAETGTHALMKQRQKNPSVRS